MSYLHDANSALILRILFLTEFTLTCPMMSWSEVGCLMEVSALLEIQVALEILALLQCLAMMALLMLC